MEFCTITSTKGSDGRSECLTWLLQILDGEQ
jgi:hypothetical protein